MQGFSYIELSHSASVHFVGNEELAGVESEIEEILIGVRDRGFRCISIDARSTEVTSQSLANLLGLALQLEHAPYDQQHWLQLSDDMITLAYRDPGLLIVVENAEVLASAPASGLFELIENFLLQLHHWLEQKKPCHLYFLLDPSPIMLEVVHGAFKERGTARDVPESSDS